MNLFFRVNDYIVDTPLIDIIYNIKSLINNGKLKDIQERGSDILITCPFHNEGLERTPSCNIYCGEDKDIGYSVFHCFGCGKKGPFYKLVAACFNQTDEWAKQWLIRNYGVYKPTIEHSIQLQDKIILKNEYKKPKIIREDFLDRFQSWHPYLEKRHLDKNICEQFKIKYDPFTKCIVFPVWDDKNNLIMLTKRSVLSKAFYIDKDIEKPVYLLNYIKQNNIKTIYVCESQINALTLWGWGKPAVALFGTGTKYQYNLLNKSGITTFYICLDGDEAGDKGTKRLLSNLKKDKIINVVSLPRGKDINDLTQEEFNQLLTNIK